MSNQRFCAQLRKIHREIMIEFDKIDKRQEWTYSWKGITVKYTPTPVTSVGSSRSTF
jgi:hypothetical protein